MKRTKTTTPATSRKLTNNDIKRHRSPAKESVHRTSQHNKNPSGNRAKLVKIGALWLKEGRSGRFMSGTIAVSDDTDMHVLVFKNDYKEQDRHPDYVVFEAPDNNNSGNDGDNDDDIPF